MTSEGLSSKEIAMGFISELFDKPDIEFIPAPDQADATAIAEEEQRKLRISRERFLERRGTLGPIQLQAPVLKV
jgi:hypothetical protein